MSSEITNEPCTCDGAVANPHDKSCDYIAGLEDAQMAASETALGHVCHYSGRASERCAGAIEVMKAVDEALEYRRDEREFWVED
jgi:hypothetical protein